MDSSSSKTTPQYLSATRRTGKPTRQFAIEGTGQTVAAWACSPGAEVVAAVSEPGWKLKLWDGQLANCWRFTRFPNTVGRLYFSHDGATLVAVGIEGMSI